MADLQRRIEVEIYNIAMALDEHKLLSLAVNARDIFSEFKEDIKEYFTE